MRALRNIILESLNRKVISIVLLIVIFYSWGRGINSEVGPFETDKQKVAILPFKNLGDLPDITNVNVLIKNKLNKSGNLHVIDELKIQKALKARGLEKKDPRDLDFVKSAGIFLRVDYVVSGYYSRNLELIEIHGSIWEVRPGRVIGTTNVEGANLGNLINDFLNDLIAKFEQIPSLSRTEGQIKEEPAEVTEVESEKVDSRTAEKSEKRLTEARERTATAESEKLKTKRKTDFGWVSIIAKPMFSAIMFINRYFADLGFAVILFSVILYLIFFLLNFNYRRKYRELQPDILALQLRYAYDKPTMQQELLQLYKERGFNPYAGCLYLAIQLLLLFMLYFVFTKPEEFKNVSTFLWITDLSGKDPYFILPILGGVVLFTQILIQKKGQWQSQSELIVGAAIISIIIMVIFYFLPSGMVLVFLTFTFLGAIQHTYEMNLSRMTLIKAAFPQLATLLVFIVAGNIFFSPQKPTIKPGEMIAERTPEVVTPTPEPPPPKNVALHNINALLSSGKWQEAIQEIDSKISTEPENKSFIDLKVEALYNWSVNILHDEGERYLAYSNLNEALKILPAHANSKIQLAGIYSDVGKEELFNICIRKGPSEFYSLKRFTKKGEILRLDEDETFENSWLAIDEEDHLTGWIYKPLVERIRRVSEFREVKVIGKRAKKEVYALFNKALELNPGLKRKVFWMKYKNVIIPITVVCIFVLGIAIIIFRIY